MPDATERRNTTPAVIALIGGVVLVISSFLPWFKVAFRGASQTVAGTKASDGKITLVCGLLVAIAAVVILVGKSAGLRRGMAILAIVAGLAGAAVGAIDLFTKDRQVDDILRKSLAGSTGHTATAAELALAHKFLDRLGFSISASIGIYLILAGGLVGLVGGAMAVAQKEAAPAAPPYQSPGGGGAMGFTPSAPPAPSAPSAPSAPASPAPPAPQAESPPEREAPQDLPPPSPPPQE
jgi:tryptophan-associated transmembrane protein